jgi:hypothetical protein
MIWSVSSGKQFEKCARQWYYKNIAAHALVKNDPDRRAITILSKVKSVDAWRGTIVDNIISKRLTYAINKKFTIKKDYFITEALKEFQNQLKFAKSKKYWDDGFVFSEEEDFAALYPYEFNIGLSEIEIQRLETDIIQAISQLLDDKELIEYLQSSSLLISQRALTYKFNKFTVRGFPDLIAFFSDRPPHIFDWKVHTFGTKAYDHQLIAYAYALYKTIQVKPHNDFPLNLSKYSINEYRLTEYQLLQKESPKRDYEVTDESINNLTKYISSSILSIYMSGGCEKYEELQPEMFETTYYPENCTTCPFKLICKHQEDEIRSRCVSDTKSGTTFSQLSLM